MGDLTLEVAKQLHGAIAMSLKEGRDSDSDGAQKTLRGKRSKGGDPNPTMSRPEARLLVLLVPTLTSH